MSNTHESRGETPPDLLGEIQEAAIGLLLDGKSGAWGGGPTGLTDRHVTYVLAGENIGEGGTFFLMDCDKSRFGLAVSARQYSESDISRSTESAFTPDMFFTSEKAKPVGALTLINYFDIDEGTFAEIEELHTADTEASDHTLADLLSKIRNDELEEVILGASPQVYSWTKLDHMEQVLQAMYYAFIRAAGDSQELKDFAGKQFLGIRPEADYQALIQQKARLLPHIIDWLKTKLFRGSTPK